jgi:hypothetical protein
LPADVGGVGRFEQRIQRVGVRWQPKGSLADVDVEVVVQQYLFGELPDADQPQADIDAGGFEVRPQLLGDPNPVGVAVDGKRLDFERELRPLVLVGDVPELAHAASGRGCRSGSSSEDCAARERRRGIGVSHQRIRNRVVIYCSTVGI